MRLAIAEARKNLIDIKGGPFGACIAKGENVLSVSRNTVLKNDATCHAEINAIKEASRKMKSYDLSGCFMYSTNEPCPMCFGAIHWAKVDTVIYGTTVKDAQGLGFNEMRISNRQLKRLGASKVKIISGFLKDDCRHLLSDWLGMPDKVVY